MNSSKFSNSRATSIIWIVAAGLAIILGGVLLSTLTPIIFPTQASAESQQVDDLFRFMLAIGGGIFLLVQGVLLFSVLRFRAKAGDLSDGPPVHGNATLELVWTVIPAIIVFILTIYSYQVWTSIQSQKANEQVIDVVGQRFAWAFTYDLPQSAIPADFDVTTLPDNLQQQLTDNGQLRFTSTQLHTWVGQPVKLEMTTEDVNHAFWIPAMRVKQDLLAGRTTELRFTPTEPGAYRVVCAELCGSGHGNMAGEIDQNGNLIGAWLIVHPDEEAYNREFFAIERDKVLFPPEDPVERGRLVLASGAYPCATCHILNDLGWQGNIGPNLNGIGERASRRVPGQSAEQYLTNSIRHPGEYLVPGFGNLMPQFNADAGQPNYMPDEDLAAIVAYLLAQN